ncbi:quinone oxidoreductase family protein [Ktedonobacter robiniae]|uniref:Oxidoreductase n=1 Tax=Ktedonobacter robiniae TaxID=2778365 RepID=A0ABQ3UUX4_9CHLR|nr:NADPH:quinone oxidoreductase family protein [Ktedonobacter robiniae]GHO56499.1 oxidoreductase [Ktedonobacter robiniae]
MKLVRYYTSGAPEVLQVEEVAIPQPEAGQVLVKVEAIDVGYVDTQIRSENSPWGTPTFPVAPGDYVYGTVAQVGPEVGEVQVGERILGFAPVGAYAEYALVPLSLRFQPLPEASLSPEELVALPVAGDTAYHLLATSAQLRPGERVLIHAAAGGIGHFAVQLARAMGAGQIIATASSATKLDMAQTLGADTLINYTEPGWTEQVMQATGGKGVDVILDVVGGQILVESLPLLAPFGRLIVSGAASGHIPALPSESVSQLMMGLKRIEGFSSFTLMQQHPDLIAQGRQAFRRYVEQGNVRPRIMRTFALEEVAEAHRLLESRASYGKIVLRL